jgi:hypothetical protein
VSTASNALPPRYVVLANPESKRWQAYLPELLGYWRERGAEADVNLVPWEEVAGREGNLDGLSVFDRPALVRLESPGRDFEVTKLLLEIGSRACPAEPVRDWRNLAYRKGLQLEPRLLYAGFVRVLRGLRTSLDARPHLTPLACPLAVAEMFDKNATCDRLRSAGLPCPSSVSAPPTTPELIDHLRQRRWEIAYVKLNTGSSASAIIVLHALADPPWGLSSLVELEDGFYSTRRLQRLTGDRLDSALRFLLQQGACIQQGIRMAQVDGHNFDVRVVVIHGRPAFTVFRLSRQPMTNLHLGGRRGDPAHCRAQIPVRAWLDALDDCTRAAELYDARSVGVDLLFEHGFGKHYILEVNAFGDFFPNLVDQDGRTVHRVEIEAEAGL